MVSSNLTKIDHFEKKHNRNRFRYISQVPEMKKTILMIAFVWLLFVTQMNGLVLHGNSKAEIFTKDGAMLDAKEARTLYSRLRR